MNTGPLFAARLASLDHRLKSRPENVVISIIDLNKSFALQALRA
jgi:hypothetical protein